MAVEKQLDLRKEFLWSKLPEDAKEYYEDHRTGNIEEWKDEPWAQDLFAYAAHTSMGFEIDRLLPHFIDKPITGSVLMQRARDGGATHIFDHPALLSKPYAETLLKEVAEGGRAEYIFSNSDKFSNEPYAGNVLKAAASDNTHVAFDNYKNFKNQPYAKEVLQEAVTSSPLAFLDIRADIGGIREKINNLSTDREGSLLRYDSRHDNHERSLWDQIKHYPDEYDSEFYELAKLAIVFVAIAILYNPVGAIHLFKEAWIVLNILTVIIFGYGWKRLCKGNKTDEK